MVVPSPSRHVGEGSATMAVPCGRRAQGRVPVVAPRQAQQRCEGCHNLFGEYYCSICHLFDRDKQQYHCAECGICRIGPKEDFFHCSKCNLCLSLSLLGKHKCIENVSRQDCPICLEDIHTSRVGAHVLPCGHLLHRTCYEDMLKEGYRCPLCMRSALDMTRYWRQLDDEVALTPMPPEYQNMMVQILCNDCNARSTAQFHLLGMKCGNCDSYNTAQDGTCRLAGKKKGPPRRTATSALLANKRTQRSHGDGWNVV
nr:RING finger and CHY zinc finger domain-containing protein 1 [Columba livia]